VDNTPRTGAVILLRQDRTGKELPPGEGKNRVQVMDVPLVSKDKLKSPRSVVRDSGVYARRTPQDTFRDMCVCVCLCKAMFEFSFIENYNLDHGILLISQKN
jgi:hypothetical protein